MSTCISKYSKALSYFNSEKGIFMKNLEDLTARGVDKYDARDIWNTESTCLDAVKASHYLKLTILNHPLLS